MELSIKRIKKPVPALTMPLSLMEFNVSHATSLNFGIPEPLPAHPVLSVNTSIQLQDNVSHAQLALFSILPDIFAIKTQNARLMAKFSTQPLMNVNVQVTILIWIRRPSHVLNATYPDIGIILEVLA